MDYRGIDDIRQCLTAVQQRRWRLRLLAGLAAIVTILSAVLVVVTLTAGYWSGQPPAALRWGLLIVAAGALLIAAARFVLRPFAWRQTPAQVARFVEQARPELRNDLVRYPADCGIVYSNPLCALFGHVSTLTWNRPC